MSAAITSVEGRAVYDSNCVATVEVTIGTESGAYARAFAQRGSSTGRYEAYHLERAEAQPATAAVAPALRSVRARVAPALIGADVRDQTDIDARLEALDPSPTREAVGGNVLVAASMAAAELGARLAGEPPWRHLAPDRPEPRIAQPTFNVIDGSLAPFSKVQHHEFLLFPAAGMPVAESIEMAVRVRDEVRRRLYAMGQTAADSPQGAVAAALDDVPTGLGLVADAATAGGYAPDRHFFLGLDMAAADVHDGDRYAFGWAPAPLDRNQLRAHYLDWFAGFPLRYLEDGFAEECGDDFARLGREAPPGALIAGDDLFASNAARVKDGLANGWAGAVVLKPNQIGTVTGLLTAGELAAAGRMDVLLSQRSGENDSALIAHLGVAAGASYIKCGGPARLDRVIKLNELLRLEEELA